MTRWAAFTAVLLAASSAVAQTNPVAPYFSPQTVVRLPDGRSLNLICSGEGAPVVVLIGGLGLPSEAWSRAQPLIAQHHKTCAFDPPGYRFSDPAPAPRTAVAVARDVHDGLEAAKLAGPYVLVAHSRAGYDARQFARRYPGETAGLVLLDVNADGPWSKPTTPDPDAEAKRRASPDFACIYAIAEGRLAKDSALAAKCGAPPPDTFGGSPRTARAVLDQVEQLDADAAAMRGIMTYGAIPMIVVTAADLNGKYKGKLEDMQAIETAHKALAAQSSRGQQRSLQSGHVIMFEKPAETAQAVEDVIALGRR